MKDINFELYRVLKELEIVPVAKLDLLLAQSKKANKGLYDLLLDNDIISDNQLGKVIADMYDVPYVHLAGSEIKKEILKIIPQLVAQKQQVIAFKKDKNGLYLAMANPKDRDMVDFIGKKTGLPILVYYATNRDIENALNLYEKGIEQALLELISEAKEKTKGDVDPSIIKIVDMVVGYAYRNKTSDIHIEPYEEKTLIRYRIDGVLHDIVELPKTLHNQVITRLKVLAHLRTDEHQAPQDGKISYKLPEEDVDIRVSIVPIVNGEKVVMRLLSEKSRQFSLVDLGLGQEDLHKVETAYKKPHGMILSTGPTGSGKTTTLYAVLKLLNDRDVNIMTIEDPVEYDIDGVNQIQVNSRTNLTFADGLRSIVRQDPDIILVGEIRDNETANISVNAAMTGHLVLSTLHTNDAATTIPRLFDLGVEPYLAASTISVIIGQRLVRKICESCRVSIEVDSPEFQNHESPFATDETYKKLLQTHFAASHSRLYFGKGCPVCHETGYMGRIGIFEVLLVNEPIRRAITERKNASEIQALAIESGMRTMLLDGIEKVKLGLTTIDELLRVTKE